MHLTEWARQLALLGYLGALFGMLLESAAVPLPSELILPLTGYLVARGRLDFWLAAAAVTVGGTAGSALAYAVARLGGRALALRYGGYVHLRERELEAAERFFARYGRSAVFFGRLLPVIRTFIALPAGFARMPFGTFLAYTLLGAIPWNLALLYGGVVLGRNWQAIAQAGSRATAVVVALLVVGALVWALRRRRARA